ncbi:hypothetical protein SSABA_v1c07700 [Spiroplasma sabaudiense Ar-1343]|uniref:Transmembrane protein n=1 Tax=Spiroplasma sabaudiense Ar-1343 TaxID=1276257 RepID=W6AAU7_9MOLU|nr:hypothetical protein [Spiroplasma sabaudiense]AHI54172.1 hypothetical protein SSABA_v1c07700 [Spiroplasma sabaudiense Ar-1343]
MLTKKQKSLLFLALLLSILFVIFVCIISVQLDKEFIQIFNISNNLNKFNGLQRNFNMGTILYNKLPIEILINYLNSPWLWISVIAVLNISMIFSFYTLKNNGKLLKKISFWILLLISLSVILLSYSFFAINSLEDKEIFKLESILSDFLKNKQQYNNVQKLVWFLPNLSLKQMQVLNNTQNISIIVSALSVFLIFFNLFVFFSIFQKNTGKKVNHNTVLIKKKTKNI